MYGICPPVSSDYSNITIRWLYWLNYNQLCSHGDESIAAIYGIYCCTVHRCYGDTHT